MNYKAIADAIIKFSPAVATAVSGPIGGIVTSLLATWFNVHPENLADTIAADPNAEFQLKQFALEHKDDLQRIASTNYQTEVEDREDARKREIEKEKITGKTDWVLSSIAISVVVGFFILCFLNYFYKSPEDQILIMLLGQISAGFTMVLSYFFGSSQKKD